MAREAKTGVTTARRNESAQTSAGSAQQSSRGQGKTEAGYSSASRSLSSDRGPNRPKMAVHQVKSGSFPSWGRLIGLGPSVNAPAMQSWNAGPECLILVSGHSLITAN
jgi:hypothetical protein